MKDQDAYMVEYTSWMTKHGGFARDITIRDYFAAKAMQSLFAGAIADAFTLDQDINCDMAARIAYTMADAMLKAREQ